MAADLLVSVTLAVRAAETGEVLPIANHQQYKGISVSKICWLLHP